MSEDLTRSYPVLHPTPERPLQGMSVLVVEDSRYASEAIRLLSLHSGARVRRADSLASAHRHLALYQPTVVIIDDGLPDGSGVDLIAELANANPRVPVLIGMSGDPDIEEAALQAGADDFLAKPVVSLALFQQVILAFLPDIEGYAKAPRLLPDEIVEPDQQALTSDLTHLAQIMQSKDSATLGYAAQFLGGVARMAHDPALEDAARKLAAARAEGRSLTLDVARVSGMVEDRLQAG
ncbi:MAG: response regulator [Maritimibacter sp.]